MQPYHSQSQSQRTSALCPGTFNALSSPADKGDAWSVPVAPPPMAAICPSWTWRVPYQQRARLNSSPSVLHYIYDHARGMSSHSLYPLLAKMASSSQTVHRGNPAPRADSLQRPIVPQAWYREKLDGPTLPGMRFASGVAGIPMDQLLLHRQDPTALRNLIPIYDDRGILTLRVKSIRLVILWPGYEHKHFHREIHLTMPGAGGVSCAGELAVAIADTYDWFLKQAVSWTPQGNRKEWFLTREANFVLGDLALIAAHHMGGNIFQAVVELGFIRHMQSPSVPLTTVYDRPRVRPQATGRISEGAHHPTPVVTAGSQEGQRNPSYVRKNTTQQYAHMRSEDFEALMRRGEAAVAHVESDLRRQALIEWIEGALAVEKDLPGPTGGLVYPYDD
ncbi:hypothetical protein C8T65DRAFT_833899 [Cerioporus squamosus]|nr:hypothetical protein C8T65DRAFT_833899 [Cerioporus squamosus]